jgi:pimeloyl-ACP methyl ester carboxylesterase
MKRNWLVILLTVVSILANAQATDYSQLSAWAAHPAKWDPSDSIPAFCQDLRRDSSADVFFLHPTTFAGLNFARNAAIDNESVNRQTDTRVLQYQATIFNGSCRIFAPRYRQAHIRNFLQMNSDAAKAAFDTAYADLAAAFSYYLEHENKGRPIVIAAHSQGAMHALRLLHDFFDGKPLQQKLVVAYVVGWPIPRDAFAAIPFGRDPEQVGCVVGWQSYAVDYAGFELRYQPKPPGFCVNPITWLANETAAGPAEHLGALGKDFNSLHIAKVKARVDSATGVLRVTVPPGMGMGVITGNWHIADFNLFWMDVRHNVAVRIEAFRQKERAAGRQP